MTTVRYSCVVDDDPLFRIQALNWVWTIDASGSGRPDEIVVHLVEGQDTAYERILDRLGVTGRWIERFGAGEAAYCNKLMQLACSCDYDADCVVMCDADIAFAGNFRPWITSTAIRAKVVDLPNPPLEIIERLYAATGLKAKPRIVETSLGNGLTYETNCNGGLYVVPMQCLGTLTKSWLKWARFALEQGATLGAYRKHADQIGFCFAMLELGLPFEALPDILNFPTHLPPENYAPLQGPDPLVLHYHRHLDQSGFLLPLGIPQVDSSIDRVNQFIRDCRHKQFDNRTFWDYRYTFHPALGSGLGSRGDPMVYKRQIVAQTVKSLNPSSILDIGCGDQFVTETIPDNIYTGIDISPIVIAQNKSRYPERRYVRGDFLEERMPPHALTLCFDVILHLDNIDLYREFVGRVVSTTRGHGVISGFEEEPGISSDITFFHEPLSQTLLASGATNLKRLGKYRDTTIWHFQTPEAACGNTPLSLKRDLSRPRGMGQNLGRQMIRKVRNLFDQAIRRSGEARRKMGFELPKKVTETQEPLPTEMMVRQPVFVVGCMRSGTTLLAELLGDSPGIIYCPFELKDIWSRAGEVPMASPKTGDRNCPALAEADARLEQAVSLSKAFRERMAPLRQGKSADAFFLNKNPHLCNKLPFVKALFPDARFIWIRRHLPQVVASMKRLLADVYGRQRTRHYWHERAEGEPARCWDAFYKGEELPEALDRGRVFPGGNLHYLAEYWLETNLAVLDFLEMLPADQGLGITVENLIAAPRTHLTRCLGFLSVTLTLPEDLDSRVDRDRADHWKSLLTRDEMQELLKFIEDRAEEIDRVYGESGTSLSYMNQITATLRHGDVPLK